MNRHLTNPLAISLLIVTGVFLFVLFPREDGQVRARPIDLSIETDVTGFARAMGPRPLEFPRDHGPHPDYQTEWWYYTGNLETSDGRHFGFQLTFFRRALAPATRRQDRPSPWATDQIYMAHFAVTDVAGKRYLAFERFSRGAAGLAGAEPSPYRVWLENWSVEETQPDSYRLRAAQGGWEIDLQMVDKKEPILQGDRGYSQKGPERGNASHYYSLTRLASSGTVRVDNNTYKVSGLAWMDHEYSTSGLGDDLVGWDWFSLQLDDASELMVYQFRRQDGSIDPFSSGTLIAPDGSTRRLTRDDFLISVSETWRSPVSGATYPARWTLIVPMANLTVEIVPHLPDQELNVSYAYWEGAVAVSGERGSSPLEGNGYVELTGYATSMQNEF